MNVVLYFKLFREVQNFIFVSSTCKDAVDQLKINPQIEYGHSEKMKLWCYKIMKYFPNIETLQIQDLTYIISKEMLNKITYIRIHSNIVLKQFDFNELTGKAWDYYILSKSPYFKNEKSEYYVYDISKSYVFEN
ncbi:hypothetical protein QTN25_004856 [Entamoeba marina]